MSPWYRRQICGHTSKAGCPGRRACKSRFSAQAPDVHLGASGPVGDPRRLRTAFQSCYLSSASPRRAGSEQPSHPFQPGLEKLDPAAACAFLAVGRPGPRPHHPGAGMCARATSVPPARARGAGGALPRAAPGVGERRLGAGPWPGPRAVSRTRGTPPAGGCGGDHNLFRGNETGLLAVGPFHRLARSPSRPSRGRANPGSSRVLQRSAARASAARAPGELF